MSVLATGVTFTDEDGVSEILVVTLEHPFRTQAGDWKPAGELAVGELVEAKDQWLTLSAVRDLPNDTSTYNFMVAENHNYFVGEAKLWVHNCCGEAISNASAAFKAADNIANWIPKDKHMFGTTAARSAQFHTNTISDVQEIVAQALRSPNARFMQNNVDGSFRVVTDLGYPIGTKGQTQVRVIVGDDGKIWNAFPVNVQ